jgi:8-oxo-dGTP diphosphatase
MSALIRVAVGVLKRGNTVLVAERPPHKPYAGYWEFPGGKIEPSETTEQALKRELHEELGINIITAEPWFEHIHHYPDKSVQLEMWLVTDFLPEPHSKEDQQLRWVTFDEMQQLRLLEGNLPIMSRVKQLIP